MRVRSGVIAVVLAGVTLGCGDSDVANKMKKAKEERNAGANEAVEALLQEYVTALVDRIPPETDKGTAGEPHPMSKWRKEVAGIDFAAKAKKRGEELKDTPAAADLADAVLLFTAVRDYWLGRNLEGPELKKEWEEGYEASAKVAAKKGEKERISLKQHEATMKQLGAGTPWEMVADFEMMLPHIIQVYRYKMFRSDIQVTSFSRFLQVIYEYERINDDTGPEQYSPYRDRLCDAKIGDACKVPYESRDIVVKRVYMERLGERLAAFKKKHGGRGLDGLIGRFVARVEAEVKDAVVPPEYPVMPDTLSPVWSAAYTILEVGSKGAILHTNDPNEKDTRVKKVLLDPRADWNLSAEDKLTLSTNLATEIGSLRDEGAGADYTTQLYLQLDKEVPFSVVTALLPAMKPANIKLLDFVGRRRIDGTLQIKRMPGSVFDETAAMPFAPSGGLVCWPVASLGATNVPPDLAKHTVWLKPGGKVTAGPEGKTEITATLADAAKVGEWVRKLDKPTLVGVWPTVTNAELHALFNAVAVKCDEPKECTKPQLVDKLVLAACENGDVPKDEDDKKKK